MPGLFAGMGISTPAATQPEMPTIPAVASEEPKPAANQMPGLFAGLGMQS